MRYAKGICWIGDCRIPFVDEGDLQKRLDEENSRKSDKVREGFSKTKAIPNLEQQGRFTPNLLVCDDMLNDGIVSKSGNIKPHKQKEKTLLFNSEYVISSFVSDKGTNSRYYDLDKWFDKVIDELC